MSNLETKYSDWKETKLGDIAEIIGGGTPKTSVLEYWNGNIPWITPRDLTGYNKTYIERGERNITKNGLSNSSARLIPKGTVLLTSRAPIGYLAIANNELSTNQGFKSLVVDEVQANNLFVYYWLKSNIEYLKSIGTGSTFAEISGNVVKEISIFLPSLSEQKAIAEVLSSLDDKIDFLHRQNKTLEDIVQALFRKQFIQIANSEWKSIKFNEVVKIFKGKKPDSTSKLAKDGFLPQILIETFNNDKFLYANPKGMVLCEDTDILMVMDGSVGRLEIGYTGIIGSTIGLFRANKNFNYPQFLFYFLKTKEKIIKENTTGSVIPHADKKLILNFPIRYKNIQQIESFEIYAQNIFQKINQNKLQIRILKNLHNILLLKLMNKMVKIQY